jgi:dihydrofolate reductase
MLLLYSLGIFTMTTTLYLCVSLDGFIATSDGSSAWPDGAWVDWCGYCTDANSLIVGRVSYSGLVQHDLSEILYPEHKVVISSQDLNPAQGWLQFQTPKQAVEHLKSCDVKNIVVGGGRDLGTAFIRDGLIDEIILDVQPVCFGTGINLLGDLKSPIELELISRLDLGHDAIRMHYKIIET